MDVCVTTCDRLNKKPLEDVLELIVEPVDMLLYMVKWTLQI